MRSVGNIFSKTREKAAYVTKKMTIIVDLTAVAYGSPTRVSVLLMKMENRNFCDPKKEIALRCIGKEQKAK